MATTEQLTFEKVLAMFQETDKKFQETDRQFKETDRKFQETDRKFHETDWEFQETKRIIGRLGNRFGEMVEHLVVPNITNKFKELGFTFEQVSKDHRITDASGHCIAEIDIMLENGDIVMVVEVKAKPLQTDVDDHVNCMEILRRRADARQDRRKYRGAIAGAIMDESVRRYSHKAGFYVIEQAGDTLRINIPEGFVPREW